MTNIIKKAEEKALGLREWDPFRRFRDLFAWDPFREMVPMATEIAEPGFVPDFDVKETKEAYTFKADLPGVLEKDLEIALTGNRLSVAGKREKEERQKGETFYTFERTYGAFTRVFTLPEGIDADHVVAELREGVLTLVVPKKAEVQPKNIPLRPVEKKS
jgi:HSP20 family protein